MNNGSGKLYIITTPIGNLEDISQRAVKMILSLKNLACEDVRRTALLVNELRNRHKSFTFSEKAYLSYYNEVEINRTPKILEILSKGEDVGLVTDSGTPLVSDPGHVVVREALKKGIEIETIPGPSAVITALTLSGFPLNSFLFLGFLPDRLSKKRKTVESLSKIWLNFEQANLRLPTLVFYEAPHRLSETLNILEAQLPESFVAVCRELTKIHQEVKRGKITELAKYYSENLPRGEFTLVISPQP